MGGQTEKNEWMSMAMDLAVFRGPSEQFWQNYRKLVRILCDAQELILYSRAKGGPAGEWAPVAQSQAPFATHVTPELLRQQNQNGQAFGKGASGKFIAILTLMIPDSNQETIAVLVWARQPVQPLALTGRFSVLAALPALYQSGRNIRSAARDAQRFGQVLSLTGNMLDAENFDLAASVLANRLSELFACETTYICWRAREGQKLRAISHGELPDRRSQESALVEEVAQEALTQQCEVSYPSQSKVVSFAAERFTDLSKYKFLMTLPMIHYSTDGSSKELGALTLCRNRSGFSEAEQWALRLISEMAQPVLENAFLQSKRWLLPRLGREIGKSLPKFLRAKTVSGKMLLAGGVVALIGLAFLPVPFRISATAIVKTDAMGFVGAPYGGFIEASTTIIGDKVNKGQILFKLSQEELVLEREALLADLAKANRDAEVNRSLGKLPEMLLAQARAQEIKPQLKRLDRQIASAEGIAPLDGVVVEGEPAKKLGQAVNRGEALVTVAALTGLYIEAAVSERDLGFIQEGGSAQLTLLSNPNEAFDLTVQEIIPSAALQDAENVFPVRMNHSFASPGWWLPGMTGVIKLDAGRASLGWITTRKLREYLQLKLWF